MSGWVFEPTERDHEGLARLKDEITRDHNRHEAYEVSCFQRQEAEWIEDQLLRWRPELDGRLFMKWMVFPQ